MKFNMCHYFGGSLEEPEGGLEESHQGGRRPLGGPPRERREASWFPGPTFGAPLCPILPPGVKTLKQEELRSFTSASWRKPTEKKSHLRRADSAGEITSRKGRSSSSSSPSSRASSRSAP